MAAKPLSIRLTDEERATLTERAGDEQLSAYIRRAALGFVEPRVTGPRSEPPPKDREAFIQKRAEELGAEGINPLRIVQLAEAEWDEIQREETE